MRNILFLSIFIFIAGCAANKNLEYQSSKLIIIESDDHRLFKKPDLNSAVANTIKKGSILFYTSTKNEFVEVYTRNPMVISKGNHGTFKYYIHDPKYSNYTSNYSKKNASIVELPFDESKKYIRGDRGGCYYINSNQNKTYVNRSYCNNHFKPSKIKSQTSKNLNRFKSSTRSSSTCGARTKSGGYCKRKVKGGGRCYQH